jgi:ferredoxin
VDVILPAALDAMLAELARDGWRVVGPTVRDGAVVYAEIRGIADLPAGVGDAQEAGRYRLVRRNDGALFGFASASQSFKPEFFAPRSQLLQIRRHGRSFEAESVSAPPSKLALIGARGCDLAGIAVQDRTFVDGHYRDPDYVSRRAETFVVAVHCGQAGGTCFCVSMGTGPRVRAAFDLALTELLGGEHRFLVEVGSDRGGALLARLERRPATDEDRRTADAIVERTAQSMGRTMEAKGVPELLLRNLEHPRWNDVAARCLSCTNCTLVCPTCFCSSVEDTTDLAGETAERWRRWDSCYTLDHSYLHGGSVRPTIRGRYRQWLTHKLATWWDQFGTSGCVGCGRCITWCPTGIDLTEEVAAIRATDGAT